MDVLFFGALYLRKRESSEIEEQRPCFFPLVDHFCLGDSIMSWWRCRRLLYFVVLELLVVISWNCVSSAVWYKASRQSTKSFFLSPCSQWSFPNSSATCSSSYLPRNTVGTTQVAIISMLRSDFALSSSTFWWQYTITAFSVAFLFTTASSSTLLSSYVKISQLGQSGAVLSETAVRPNAASGLSTQTPSCVVVIRSGCYRIIFTLVAAANTQIALLPPVFVFTIDTVTSAIETCSATANAVMPNVALSTSSTSASNEATLSTSLSASSTMSVSFSLSSVATEDESQTLSKSLSRSSVTFSAVSMSAKASLAQSTSSSTSNVASENGTQTFSTSPTPSVTFSASSVSVEASLTFSRLSTSASHLVSLDHSALSHMGSLSKTFSDAPRLSLSLFEHSTKAANGPLATHNTFSNTVSLPLDPPSPPPATDAPITAATAVVAVSVNVATAMLAASAAGGALMQATLGASHCAKSSSSQDGQEDSSRSIQPTMYLVTPFYGVNGFAMVFGNVALVLLCALVHVVVSALMHRMVPHMGGGGAQRRAADVLAYYRFPNFSILPAVYAVQGITLGGWGLLWDVINPTSSSTRDGGATAGLAVANVVTWIVSIVYPAALLWWLWRLRVSLIAREGNVVARVEKYACFLFAPLKAVGASTVRADRLHEALIPYELLPRLAALRSLGPRMSWTPRNTRLIFGAAFNAYEPTSTLTWISLLWLAGDVVLLPTVVSIASTTKPTAESRWAVCNGVMLCGGMLLLMYSVALALARPYRTGARNLLSPLVVLLTAVTCMLSCPLVTDTLGPGSTNDALGSVSAMQSITVLLLAVSNIVIFVTVDQRIARMECSGSDEMGEMKEISVLESSVDACPTETTIMFDGELPFLPVGSSTALNADCLPPSCESDTRHEWDSFGDCTAADAGFLFHLQPACGIDEGRDDEADDDHEGADGGNIAEFHRFANVVGGGPSELVQMYSALEERWTEDKR